VESRRSAAGEHQPAGLFQGLSVQRFICCKALATSVTSAGPL
jgi:hypothetical protein